MNPSKERPVRTATKQTDVASPETQGDLHPGWKKLGAVADVVSKVLVPIVLGIVGLALNSALKEKDVGVKMVELAVGILKVDPGNPATPQASGLRDWAIRVIDHYSEVPLQEAASELRTRPLRTEASSSGLLVEAVFRTVDASGRQVQGLEVLCTPPYSPSNPKVIEPSAQARATLFLGIYECWSRDPISKREGSHVEVTLLKGEETVKIPAPE